MRVVNLLKRWSLQNEQWFCMGIKDKKHVGIKKVGNNAFYSLGFMGNCLDHLQQFDRNPRETCLAGQYLQSIDLDNVEQQKRALLKQKCFKNAGTNSKVLESLQIIEEEHWRKICHILTRGAKWKLIIYPYSSIESRNFNIAYLSKAVINRYLVSLLKSIELYEWQFTPLNMNVALTLPCIIPVPTAPLPCLLKPKWCQLLMHQHHSFQNHQKLTHQ